MSVYIQVPKEYGYVITATAGTFFVALWHGLLAGTSRAPTGLKTPKAFADTADLAAASPEKKAAMHKFNCAQRAHANYLESQPSVAIAMLVAGLQYPVASAGLGAAWLVGRIIYGVGYTSGTKANGGGRATGFMIAFPIQVGLFGLAAWSGIKLLL